MTISGPAPNSSRAISVTMPAKRERKPSRTTRRGEASGKNLGTPTAAISSVIESGRIRTPVSTAERPRATERKSGTVKKSPAWRRYWKKNEVSPPRRSLFSSIAGSIRAALPRSSWRLSHHRKPRSTRPPASTIHTTADSPSHDGASGLGRTKPHEPPRRMPSTTRPRPSADRPVPARSRRAGWGAMSVILRGEDEDDRDDEHLAGEHPPPRGVRREQAADQRTGGHGDGPGGRHQAVGARAVLAPEVGGDQGDDRGHDQGRPDALEQRPADDEHGQAGREGGGERPDAVDHAADRERPLAADDLADLAAGDHQRGHDQRVQGDGRLDAGDRRCPRPRPPSRSTRS